MRFFFMVHNGNDLWENLNCAEFANMILPHPTLLASLFKNPTIWRDMCVSLM